MTPYEFEVLLDKISKEAYWQGFTNEGSPHWYSSFDKQINSAKEQLLAAYDEQQAEIERLIAEVAELAHHDWRNNELMKPPTPDELRGD